MPAKKVFFRLLLILFLVAGVTAGVVLIRQRMILNRQAAVPGGQGIISLDPASGNYKVGDKITVTVNFRTSGIAISGITTRLTYPYSGTSPELTVSNIRVNPQFAASGNWSCPTASTTAEAGNVYVDIACANISASGFSASANTVLATFDINVGSIPLNNPTVIRFDPSQSIMTQKSTGQDILKIPSGEGSTGTYTIEGEAQPAATATPTTRATATAVPATATPTKKPSAPTSTPTVRPTSTPKPSSTIRPTAEPSIQPTQAPSLPDAGISYPTIVMLGLGIVLLSVALLFAM